MEAEYLWVLTCPEDHGWGEVSEGLWGYESRVYRDREEALCRMEALLRDGEWGDAEPPNYDVEEWSVEDVLADPDLRDEGLGALGLLAMIADAAEALECFGDDELERFTAEYRQNQGGRGK